MRSWDRAANPVPTRLVLLVLVGLATAMPADSSAGRWLKAPKPKFPEEALKRFAEGSVTVRLRLAKDGRVSGARVIKSSGDGSLDDAAVKAVIKWKMDPAWVSDAEMNSGRNIVFDFNQEAMLGARYSDRSAWFASKRPGIWVFAPFPAYPERARRLRQTGQVLLRVAIGPDGKVAQVELVRSCGYTELDNAAVIAVRLWRAHKRSAEAKGTFPVTFKL